MKVLGGGAIWWCVIISLHMLGSSSFGLTPISISSSAAAAEVSRRSVLVTGTSALVASTSSSGNAISNNDDAISPPAFKPFNKNLSILQDPKTYSSLVYQPPPSADNKKSPVIVFLHGAGKNDGDISNLADLQGEYGGLLPSLLASGNAPQVLLDNFIVVAPYVGCNTKSFYDEPRSKLLQFISFATSQIQNADTTKIHLFGFSDGATLAVELLTTQRFASGIVCSYGYTGILPDLALHKLKGIPMWVFHSKDDAIFRVQNSDLLVSSLRKGDSSLIRYTRYDKDPEDFTGPTRGHTTGITASRDEHVYEWLLSSSASKNKSR
jgi:predicted peptidase